MSETPENKIVLVARLRDSTQAQLARITLDQEGIDSALMDESQAAYPGMFLVPVRLFVHEDDADDAKEILRKEGFL